MQIHWGKKSYGNPILRGDISKVKIGSYTSIAQDVIFDCGFHHNVNAVSTFPFQAFNESHKQHGVHPISKGDINIGNDVWIGEGSLIMSGVIIGDGAIVGAKSIVTKSIGDYEIWAGNPAKMIRRRFELEQIEKLIQLKWWYWSDDKINTYIHLLTSNNVKQFIDEASKIQ